MVWFSDYRVFYLVLVDVAKKIKHKKMSDHIKIWAEFSGVKIVAYYVYFALSEAALSRSSYARVGI